MRGSGFSVGMARVLFETDKALRVDLADFGEQSWVPKSAIDDDSEVYDCDEGREGELVVAEWLAKARGWL